MRKISPGKIPPSYDADKVTTEFMNEIRMQTDRGAALVGAEFLSEVLAALLRDFLIDDDISADKLLRKERPLGSFSSRITLAYCLGLVGADTYHNLDIIRGIRNDFAHDHRPISFESEQVKNRCQAFRYPARTRQGSTTRSGFEAMVSFLLVQVELQRGRLTRRKPATDFTLGNMIYVLLPQNEWSEMIEAED